MRGLSGKNYFFLGLLLLLAGVFFIVSNLSQRVGDDENGIARENGDVILIPNNGGELEGHTPRGFSGSGAGLFVGDNLNPNFPNGDGVQSFLTFDIMSLQSEKIRSAVLVSERVNVRGTPFMNLGSLFVKETEYSEFSSKIWNNETKATVCVVEGLSGGSFLCDMTDYIKRIVRQGKSEAQFILQFEKISDSDGSPDLVLFYESDSNTNESGIFNLRINDESDQEPITPLEVPIILPIVLHRVVDSGELSTRRTKEDILRLFNQSQDIWKQANIEFDVTVVDTVIPEEFIESVGNGDFLKIQVLTVNEPLTLHTYFFNDIGGPNGIAFPPIHSVIADETSVNDYRATAHEIGHLLGLSHTGDSQDRLLYKGANGENLSEEEIKFAREYAEEFQTEVSRR